MKDKTIMLKFLKYVLMILFIALYSTAFSTQNSYPEFNKYITAFTYNQIYCKTDFSTEGLQLIQHYFKYAASICDSDSERLIYDPEMQEAYNYYLNKAKKGDGEAAYKIGVATLMSFGVNKQDYPKTCIKWLRLSAKTGYLLGITSYADAINADITPFTAANRHKVEKKRYSLFLKAAKRGSPIAYAYLIPHYVYKKDHKKALYWFNRAKKINYPEIITLLAAYNYNGNIIKKNLAKSLQLYQKVLAYKNAGIPCIQNVLSAIGDIYFLGTGAKKDLKQAYYYYNQAALLNDNYAQNKLGNMYCHGLGVKKDQKKANYWYHLAWQHGYPDKACK